MSSVSPVWTSIFHHIPTRGRGHPRFLFQFRFLRAFVLHHYLHQRHVFSVLYCFQWSKWLEKECHNVVFIVRWVFALRQFCVLYRRILALPGKTSERQILHFKRLKQFFSSVRQGRDLLNRNNAHHDQEHNGDSPWRHPVTDILPGAVNRSIPRSQWQHQWENRSSPDCYGQCVAKNMLYGRKPQCDHENHTGTKLTWFLMSTFARFNTVQVLTNASKVPPKIPVSVSLAGVICLFWNVWQLTESFAKW